jgi:general secretion pathway protein A
VLRHSLRPFTPQETSHYVDERLRMAGYTGKALFENSALRELHSVTGGVPRLINVVCDGALLLGYGRGRSTLNAKAIREVARDLALTDEAHSEQRAGARKRGWLARLRRAPEGD